MTSGVTRDEILGDDTPPTDERVTELLAETIERVPIESIQPHPANPNEGDVGAIDESVDALGGKFYQVIFVQRSTGNIIAGEHRWKTLRARGVTEAPVVFLDVDDAEAARIMVGDNEIPRRHSRAVPDRLTALLTDLAQQRPDVGLAGTGWDSSDLDRMITDATRHVEFDASQQMGGIEYRIVITCRGEQHQRDVAAQIEALDGDLDVKLLMS